MSESVESRINFNTFHHDFDRIDIKHKQLEDVESVKL